MYEDPWDSCYGPDIFSLYLLSNSIFEWAHNTTFPQQQNLSKRISQVVTQLGHIMWYITYVNVNIYMQLFLISVIHQVQFKFAINSTQSNQNSGQARAGELDSNLCIHTYLM